MFKINKSMQLLLRSPSFIMLAISLVILAAQIIFIGKLRPFNSDDLYWQQVVRTWTPFSGDTFYFGTKDIFVALGPFFAIFESIFSPSRKLLIAETAIITMSSFALFYLSSLYFLRKLRIKLNYVTLLPFVWLASFGYPLVQNYLNSDWRTFQTGFAFLTFALVAAITFKDIDPLRSTRSKILSLVAVIFTGVLIYGDPYYTFFTIGPLAIFTAGLFLLKKINRLQTVTIFGGIALSLVFSKLIALLCAKAGIFIVMSTPSVFVNFDDIITNIVASFHGMLIIFGGDFFGRSAANIVTFGLALNAAILAIILYKTFDLRRFIRRGSIGRTTLPQLWAVFFGLAMALIFVVYTSSSLVAVSNYRFFILFIYCAVTVLAIVLGMTKNNVAKFIGGLLIAGTVFNIGYTTVGNSVASQGDVANNISNSLNYELIRKVESEKLTKGYASYWQANVNTYFSDNRVAFLPSLCTPDGKTAQFRWLIDGGQFDRSANRSFYLIDPDIPQPPICNRQQLDAQFGDPQKVLKVGNKSILIYNYDITRKIQ